MSEPALDCVVKHVRTLAGTARAAETSDAALLCDFITRFDQNAFQTLVHRHGTMVLRIASRVLRSEADADDVFQAAFLLLAHKARSIRKRGSVASWLHGVAHRLALHARGQRERRKAREQTAAVLRSSEQTAATAWSQLDAVLDEALAGLPEKYRTPLVHCYLEGHTQDEVARLLGTPLGTVRAWLARGREMLRKRLLRRGVALSAAGLSTALLACGVAADNQPVPVGLVQATIQAVVQPGGSRLVSAQVSALVRQGLATMALWRLKATTCALVAAGLVLAGLACAYFAAVPGSEERRSEFQPSPPTSNDSGTQQPQAKGPVDLHGDPLPPDALARLGTVRFRREDWVGAFALSPDGKVLAAVADGTVAFWDASTGKPLERWTVADSLLQCLAFTPDGKAVALGSADGTIHLMDCETGKERQQFRGLDDTGNRGGGAQEVFFDKDGKTLITWRSDVIVRLYEVSSGKELREVDAQNWLVYGLSPDARLLAYSERNSPKTLRLLELGTNQIRKQDFDSEIRRVVFDADGKRLAVGFGPKKDGKIAICETAGKQLGVLAGHDTSVFALAFSPDGKTLVSGGYDHALRYWDLKSYKELHQATMATPIYQVAFSPGGKTLICRGAENRVRLWDVPDWKEQPSPAGMDQSVNSLAWSPDSKMVACPSWNALWLWDAATAKVVRKFEVPAHQVAQVAFTADGKTAVTGDSDGMVRLWDVAGGKEQRSFSAGVGAIELLTLMPGGKTIAVWGDNDPATMHVMDTGTGKLIRTLRVSSQQPQVRPTLRTLCPSPSPSSGGKTLYGASGTHLGVLRWDLTTGQELTPLGIHDGGLSGLALSVDERLVAATTLAGSLYIWEAATGQARLVVKDGGFSTAVAFSPDSRFLALVNTGNNFHSVNGKKTRPGMDIREEVRIVRVSDGKVIHRFRGHIGGATSVQFAPDGHALASGGQDTTVLVWQLTAVTAAEPQPPPLAPDELAALWKALEGKADAAHAVINKLVAAPGQAVKLIEDHLKPVPQPDLDRVAALVKDLDSERFKTRSAAADELKKMGPSIEKPLRKFIADNPPEETRRRLDRLLADIGAGEGPTSERIRTLRALEVLERIGSRDARALLRRLGDGADGAWLTEIAKESLRRLERGSK
jgi:RNA polymerase sigma factor (sigma-70 family)